MAFASFALSDTETRYVQIMKEALALTWALEKFAEYVLGKSVVLETDYNPLVPLLGNKSLDLLPSHILIFRLHLMRFQYTIHHVPGKTLLQQMFIKSSSQRDLGCKLLFLIS